MPAPQPYVPASQSPPELTLKAVIAGIFFGVLFGAANAYLGLRAGLTISTSIPVAVMTVAAFKGLSQLGAKSSILEANLSQTIGSASSSVASGIIFTLPALFLWELAPSLLQMTLLGLAGGLLGVLFMIPLRRYLIEREHESLPYPEGTACAEVLIASDRGGATARNVFFGIGIGAFFKGLVGWLKLFPSKVSFSIPFLPKAELGTNISAALLGVGFILGPRIGAIMVGGGLLSWLVIIPGIAIWGAERSLPLYPETALAIADMSPSLIWTRYVRYIGAGAVATGGIITLVRSIPTMIESFKVGTKQLRSRLGAGEAVARTKVDLPLKVVGVGVTLVILMLTLVPQGFAALSGMGPRLLAAVLVTIFAFFFVTVSSRIVGMVGVTSNPTSGMTIATLIATSSIFFALGWTGDSGKAAALTIGCVVAIAASIAGDTSQDLKTGFLVGATPRTQQGGELLGVLTSATFVCLSVLLLDRAYGFGTEELPAPQATLMKLVIEGVLQQSLPWVLVMIGAGLAIAAEIARLPSLAFAVGIYLPVTTMVPVFLGGLLKHWVQKRAANEEARNKSSEAGVLLGSGLVGGEGLIGVAIAGAAFIQGSSPKGVGYEWAGSFAPIVALVAFGALIWFFYRRATTH